MFTGFIYIVWDTGAVTCEPIARAESMAENKFLAPHIVKTAWSLLDL